MLRPRSLLFALIVTATALPSLPAAAQRSVAGSDDDEDDEDGGKKKDEPAKPAEPPVDPKGAKKDSKGKKKDDKKKAEEERAAADKAAADKAAAEKAAGEKGGDKKADPKSTKKGETADVLDETAEDKKKRKAEDDARDKAEAAASAADKKKADDKAKLAEEKKISDDKRRVETREQRLTSAKKVRPLVRDEGELNIQVAVQPGAAVKNELVEVRFDIGKKLTVADPKFGNREPLKNLKLTAIVSDGTGKKDAARAYAVHSLGAPGAYGFHVTPPKDGLLQVQVVGDAPDGDGGTRSINVTFPIHVGVWPPPDFDDEDKKLLAKGS